MIELIIVAAIIIVVAAITIPQLAPVLRESRNQQAYEAVISTMRRAHEIAVDRRRVVVVTFTPAGGGNPARITSLQEVITPGPPVTYVPAPVVNYSNPEIVNLPTDIDFRLPSPIPAVGPDGLGTPATSPTDFGYSPAIAGSGLNKMYFQADGTVLKTNEVGTVASGVIYVSRANDISSCRAVSVLGQTGRVKGWRLVAGAWKPY